MPTLRVEHLSKSFGQRPVLRDVSFAAAEGDVVSVIGPSGCGKTTLFRCILGELRSDRGGIFLDDREVTRVPVERRGVGIVYQSYALFPHMNVRDNIAYGLRAAKRPKQDLARRVDEMLALVRLEEKSDKHPSAISGGERQRVALARALAVEPRVLLLDEAFAALDATTRSEVLHEVRGIIRQTSVTTLLITHDQEEAFLFSRHVLVLNDGEVVTSGTPEEVMQHDHPFIRDFVQMILLLRSRVELDVVGSTCVMLEGGQRIPISIPGVSPGDPVHVMIKKGPQAQSIEVWPDGEA
jgi:ABC-type Fe3+/spermidine/putrescine transport system ATPase subunit